MISKKSTYRLTNPDIDIVIADIITVEIVRPELLIGCNLSGLHSQPRHYSVLMDSVHSQNFCATLLTAWSLTPNKGCD